MLKITGVGHQELINIKNKKEIKKENKKIIFYRRWRLGDIIMCEPANRYWVNQGFDTSFCTFNQYHPIVKSFSINPPKTITYNVNKENKLTTPGFKYDNEYNLDDIGLVHDGHISKVEAFLYASGIDYNNIKEEDKIPMLNIDPMYKSWAKFFLKENKLLNNQLIAIIRQSYSSSSPRSIPIEVLDNLNKLLSNDFHVLVIGEKPVNIYTNDNIHNFTGCTPDIMSVAGLLEQCKILITGDTGLMHLAGSIGLPMVSILGPTRPEDISSFYQYNTIIDAGRECSPCFDRGCDNNCLNNLDHKYIYNVISDRLNSPFIKTTIIKV